MASDLERIADALRVIGAEGTHRTGEYLRARQQVETLLKQASSIRVEGVDTRTVVSLLEDARGKLEQAISLTSRLSGQASEFADRLAT